MGHRPWACYPRRPRRRRSYRSNRHNVFTQVLLIRMGMDHEWTHCKEILGNILLLGMAGFLRVDTILKESSVNILLCMAASSWVASTRRATS